MNLRFRTFVGLAFLFGLFWLMGYLSHLFGRADEVSSPRWLWLLCGASATGRRLSAFGVASQITAYFIPPVLIYARDHLTRDQSLLAFREGLTWLRFHMLGDRKGLREKPWHLHPGGALEPMVPPQSDPDRYRYDPADPTPNVGGPTWDFRKSGSQDNRDLEARPDVLTYTSAPLERDLDVIGPVSAELFVRSNLEHTDFFARLCDVEPSGRSMNVCDGILRLAPGWPSPEPDGCRKIAVELWPTAYQFKQGHRIRVQVSSGAFPRWSRNLGSGEPLTTGTTMRIAEQSVYHDPEHLSVIILSCG